jgi:hypothetical protein
MSRALALVCALLFLCALPALATPGGTDGNGGHTGATGEYHFHHGYPAHQHIGGVCPLDLNFTSNVITGKPEINKYTGSEDADDVVVPNPERARDGAFQGIEKRGQAGLIASGAAMALVIVGGFLSTVKWRPKADESEQRSAS